MKHINSQQSLLLGNYLGKTPKVIQHFKNKNPGLIVLPWQEWDIHLKEFLTGTSCEHRCQSWLSDYLIFKRKFKESLNKQWCYNRLSFCLRKPKMFRTRARACLEPRREMHQNDLIQSNHETSHRGLTSCILYLVVQSAQE